MPVYLWSGRSTTGKPLAGEFKAKSLDNAITQLQNRGIIVIDIKEKPQKNALGGFRNLLKRVSLKDLAIFTRQFATMIEAGIPVVQCLERLADQTAKESFKNIIKEIRRDVETGSTLAEAMGKKKNIFGDLIVSMVRVGETGGILGGTLSRVATHLEKVNALRRKVKSAMAYPMVVLVIAVLVTFFLLIFLIPTFAKLYASANIELPTPTRLVIALSAFLKRYFFFIIISLVIVGFAFKKVRKIKRGKRILDRIFIKVPIFGDLVRKASISRFARTLGILIKSGVPILDGLDITARTSGNMIVEDAVLKAKRSIGEGRSIANPLRESGIFPPLVVHLVAVGEQTGKLAEMLERVADFYEEEVDAKVSALSSILEPIMLVCVGIMVGAILIAMYLPIFSIASTVK